MDLRVSGFDWDDGNRAKCQKHGVSIAEIEALFEGSPRIAPAPQHSRDEDRLIAVGRNKHREARIRGLHNTDEKRTPAHPPGDGPVYAC